MNSQPNSVKSMSTQLQSTLWTTVMTIGSGSLFQNNLRLRRDVVNGGGFYKAWVSLFGVDSPISLTPSNPDYIWWFRMLTSSLLITQPNPLHYGNMFMKFLHAKLWFMPFCTHKLYEIIIIMNMFGCETTFLFRQSLLSMCFMPVK